MPAHQRHQQNAPQQGKDRKISGKAQNIFSGINSDIKALNSSILVISQKIKYLVRNEKILGRNLLVLNKKLKALQDARGGGSVPEDLQKQLSEISSRLSQNAEGIARLESEVENIKQNYAKAESVAEIKYVIDSINPMEFVTLKDVRELVGGQKAQERPQKKKK
ncbi:MAG: hypothetical protein NUV67_05880 [archaeon]|nr:hypothetical protein [archaeon]